MANIRQISDPRVRQLAETLKQNGLAASDSEAVRMATSMTSTESKVTQHFDKHKTGAVMKTRFSPVPPREAQDQTREKEGVAQEAAPAAQPAPSHGNNAINEAINAVQQAYAPAPSDTPLGEITGGHTSIVAEPLPQEEPPAPVQPVQVAQPVQPAVQTHSAQQPATTQEVFDKGPRPEANKFAESKVDLANVFDFSGK